MELNDPTLIDIIKIADRRGNLSVLQYPTNMPFDPVRTYWISNVPAGMMRYGHAYYSAQELVIALSGSFDVVTENVDGIKHFTLSRADRGLYIPAMTWREFTNFSTNGIALVLSSSLYDEVDYIRDKEYFTKLISEADE